MSLTPVVALLIVANLAFIIIRIGAKALEMTGVSRDAARFQALSAFFGAGFTTGESEIVVNHPIRRRVIRDLIIIGNIGLLSLLATGVMTASAFRFDTPEHRRDALIRLTIIVSGLVVLWLASRSRVVMVAIDHSIAFALRHTGALRALDYEQLLRTHSGYEVAELAVEKGSWLCGKTIGEASLRQRGVNVLSVRRRTGDWIGAPRGATALHDGDTLIAYGADEAIDRLRDDLTGKADEPSLD
ncbi:MAG: potassium channel family protein [Phycisphaerales bacterium]